MKKEVVIAKYDKDVSWSEKLNSDVKVTIYRKDGIENKLSEFQNIETQYLQNVGREIHTYFTHIYNNYDNLSDFNFFVQDYPFDHWEDVIEIINDSPVTFSERATVNIDEFYGYHFNTITTPCERGGVMHSLLPTKHHNIGSILHSTSNGFPHDMTNTLNVDKYWSIIFDEVKPEIYEFIPGAHFCVTKNRIHLRPREFYGKLIKLLEKDYYTPWIFERLICYIFNPNYKIK